MYQLLPQVGNSQLLGAEDFIFGSFLALGTWWWPLPSVCHIFYVVRSWVPPNPWGGTLGRSHANWVPRETAAAGQPKEGVNSSSAPGAAEEALPCTATNSACCVYTWRRARASGAGTGTPHRRLAPSPAVAVGSGALGGGR